MAAGGIGIIASLAVEPPNQILVIGCPSYVQIKRGIYEMSRSWEIRVGRCWMYGNAKRKSQKKWLSELSISLSQNGEINSISAEGKHFNWLLMIYYWIEDCRAALAMTIILNRSFGCAQDDVFLPLHYCRGSVFVFIAMTAILNRSFGCAQDDPFQFTIFYWILTIGGNLVLSF